MLRVCYIYRQKRITGFSIEEVFSNVRKQLNGVIKQTDFFLNAKKSKLSNIINVRKSEADIFHITGDVNFLALGLKKSKIILTAHDVGHYTQTLKGLRKFIYGLLWWQLPLRKAGFITTVSEFTKEQLTANFKTPSNKITVIHDPVSLRFKKDEKDLNLKVPTILQIGSGRNKNVERLIQAVIDIPCKLLLINNLNATLLGLLNQHGINYEQRFNLSSDEIYFAYKEADFIYFASTYEGFGLPIIEGQTVGRPVITSNVASMPEVAGGAAILVNPLSVDEIRSAIQTLKSSRELCTALVTRGYENVKRFDSGLIASQYLELYRKVAETNLTASA